MALLSTGNSRQDEEEKLIEITTSKSSSHTRGESTTFDQKIGNTAWLNFDVDLTEIDTKNQTFSIHCRINVFWQDETFVDGIFKKKIHDDCNHDINWKANDKYIHRYSYDEFIRNFSSYRLPLNVNKLFYNIFETEKSPKEEWTIWINPQTKDLHIFLEFKGKLIEHLECDAFPFDSQFLNIQLFYDSDHYTFTTKCPYYVYLANNFHYQLPIRVTKFKSIVQWKLLSPWIDLSKQKTYFNKNKGGNPNMEKNFGLIRLRVQRDPNFYLQYIILPLLVIMFTNFAVRSIPSENIGERLGYLVTLLLTIAAYQYTISNELPESPTLTNIDKLIICHYFIQCFFIIYVAISENYTEDSDVNELIELVLPCILAFLWVLCIFLFVIYPWYKYKYKNGADWKEMSDDEYEQFDVNNSENIQYMTQGDFFIGTDSDGGEIKGTDALTCLYTDERMKDGRRLLQIEPIDEKQFNVAEHKWNTRGKFGNNVVPRPWKRDIITFDE